MKNQIDGLRTRVLYYFGKAGGKVVFSVSKSRVIRLLDLTAAEADSFVTTCQGLGNAVCVVKVYQHILRVALPGALENTEALEVFNHWRLVMPSKLKSKFTTKRRALVVARLRDGYDTSRLKRAVDGCAGSGWHMGDNKRKQVFNSLELICRDGEHVERFEEMPPKRQRKARSNGVQGKLPSALAHLEGT